MWQVHSVNVDLQQKKVTVAVRNSATGAMVFANEVRFDPEGDVPESELRRQGLAAAREAFQQASAALY